MPEIQINIKSMNQIFRIVNQEGSIVSEYDNAQAFAEGVKEIAVEEYRNTDLKKEKQSSFAKGFVLATFFFIILLCLLSNS